MPQKDLVICDFCFQRINGWKYREHVMFVHKLNLPANLDIEKKILDDKPRIEEINRQNELNRQKKEIEKKTLNNLDLNKSIKSLYDEDPFAKMFRDISEESKRKEEEKLDEQLSDLKGKIQIEENSYDEKGVSKAGKGKITFLDSTFIICDYCSNILFIKPEYYGSHLKEKHNVRISVGYDFEKKKKLDLEFMSLSNQLNNIKKWDNEARGLQDRFRELVYRRNKEIEHNLKEIADTKELKIIWDDIIFGKDQIRIDVKRLNTIVKPIYVKGIFESLNLIKKEYFQRLYANKIYHIAIYNGNVIYEKSPGWSTLLETIEFAREYYDYKYSSKSLKSKVSKFTHLTNQELLKLFEITFDKSIYLKHLASEQSNEFRIIPISEFINNHLEESFLFRFKNSSGKVLFVWENVNDSRACHLFKSEQSQVEDTLDRIEEFINRHDLIHKRSLLHESDDGSKRLKLDLNYLTFIKHTSLAEFKYQLDQFIKAN